MEPNRIKREPLSPPTVALIVTGVVLLAAGGWYFWPSPSPSPPPVAAAPAPVAAPAPPKPAVEPHYEVPAVAESPGDKPLPALDASDAALTKSLADVLGLKTFAQFFRPEALVRHIVATVDNLPRGTYAQRLSPVQPVGGLLKTEGRDAGLVLAPANAARYAPWVKFVGGLDAKRVVNVYARYYPLFQQAYVELGYPNGYFNNRLVQVIDHLLEAPVPPQPVKLVVRRILPEYADPALEKESAGRKILIRVGPENAAIVKAKLRELRKALTERDPGR